ARGQRNALEHFQRAERLVQVVDFDDGQGPGGGGLGGGGGRGLHGPQAKSFGGCGARVNMIAAAQARDRGRPNANGPHGAGRLGCDLGVDQAAAREPSSKNSAWLISAFTISGLNGLVTRKVGSGRSPVNSRSGKAVMKITGTGWVIRMSLTASMPEEPSASWMSARIILGPVLL